MVKHTQTIRWQIADELNCLSVFDHFVKLALKVLNLLRLLKLILFIVGEMTKYYLAPHSALHSQNIQYHIRKYTKLVH